MHLAAFTYVRGTALNLEPESAARAVTGMDDEEWPDTQEAALRSIVGSGGHPRFERMLSMDLDLERGPRHLLAGLAVALDTPDGGADRTV